MKVILVPTEDDQPVELRDIDDNDILHELYRLIDCHNVTCVATPIGDAWMDDDFGEDCPPPFNERLSQFCYRRIGHQPLFGRGVITGPADSEGNTTEVGVAAIAWFSLIT